MIIIAELKWYDLNKINKMQTSQAIALNKIAVLQQKIETIGIRLTFLETTFKHLTQRSESISQNPLEKYLFDKSQVDSILSFKSKLSPEVKKNHGRHHSQQIGQMPPAIKKIEGQDKNLDAKSFRMLKQSILLNSDEINHVKQEIIELQKNMIEKIMGIEEGVAILARLTQAIEGKINQDTKKCEENQCCQHNKKQQNGHEHNDKRIDRVIKKYQKGKLPNESNAVINSKFYY